MLARRSWVAATVATGIAAAALMGSATSASASAADPQVTGTVVGPTGKAMSDQELDFCAGNCLTGAVQPTDFAYTGSNGSFAEDIDSYDVPAGTYKIAVNYLDLQTTAVLGVNPTYVPEAGYLKKSSSGTYLITSNYAAATSFTVKSTDTKLGTLKLAPFVGSTTAATYTWTSAGADGRTCPGYAVRVTLPKFPSGATMRATAYSSKSAGSKAYTAVWRKTLKTTAAKPAVSYTPAASLAGKYLTIGLVVSKSGYNSWTGQTQAYKVYAKACKIPASAVKSWSHKAAGKVRVGKTVRLTPTTFRRAGLKATYAWKVNGKLVKKGAARVLKLKRAWHGKKLTAVITVTGGGDKAITKTLKLGKIAG